MKVLVLWLWPFLVSESSPHLFPASPSLLRPNMGKHSHLPGGGGQGRPNSISTRSLAKRPWRLGLLTIIGPSALLQTVPPRVTQWKPRACHLGRLQGPPWGPPDGGFCSPASFSPLRVRSIALDRSQLSLGCRILHRALTRDLEMR